MSRDEQDPFLGTVFQVGRELDGFRFENVLGRGNSGEVYGVVRRGSGRPLALKVFMPFFEVEQMNLFGDIDADLTSRVLARSELAKTEYRFLERIDHPFVVDVFDSGTVQLSADEGDELRRRLSTDRNPDPYKGRPFVLPYIVTSKVFGRPIHDALSSLSVSEATAHRVVRTLVSLAQGLDYLHETHRYLHADVKAANVLIRDVDGFPVLIDFALCKNLNFEDGEADASEKLRLNVDWSLTPDEQVGPNHPFHRIIRQGGTRAEVRKVLFPWLDFFQYGRLLKQLEPQLRRLLPAGSHGYLQELIARLTNWESVTRLKVGGLSPLIERIAVTELYSAAAPSAMDNRSNVRHLPGGRRVIWPEALKPIIENLSFNRLSGINQLSLLPAVLPGATHSRLLHVFETLRVTQRAVRSLSDVPAFRTRYGSKEVQQLLALALLHDINHVPFLHLLQESELPGIGGWEVVDIMCGGKATGEHDRGLPSVYELLSDIDLSPDRFKRLVLDDWARQEGDQEDVDRVSNSLLKSGVDVDKLSYLPLDSESSGHGFANGLPVDDLLDSLLIAEIEGQEGEFRPHIAYKADALPGVEAALTARYWSFVHLYWSPDNRAMMALFFDVVRRLLTSPDEVTGFLQSNVFSSDREFIGDIERRYRERFDEASGLLRMVREPHTRPVQILTSGALFEELKKLPLDQRRLRTDQLGKQLYQEYGRGLPPSRVLVDIPDRELDIGGRVFIMDRKPREILEISGVAKDLSENYRRLSRQARVFVEPSLALAMRDRVGDDERLARRISEMLEHPPRQLQ